MLIPFQWIGLFATATVFAVMFSIGLMLGREQIAAAMQRRIVLLAVIFAVVVPVPALAVLSLKLLGLTGPVAVGDSHAKRASWIDPTSHATRPPATAAPPMPMRT